MVEVVVVVDEGDGEKGGMKGVGHSPSVPPPDVDHSVRMMWGRWGHSASLGHDPPSVLGELGVQIPRGF